MENPEARVVSTSPGRQIFRAFAVYIFQAVLTSRVSRRIGRTRLTTDGGETNNSRGLLAHAGEHVNRADVADIVGNLEFTIGTGALGVDNTLGDALAVKVSEQVDQVEILEQERALGAHALPFRRGLDGAAVGGGVDGPFVVPLGRGGLVRRGHGGQ